MDLADGVFGDVSIPSEPAEAEEAIRRLLDVSSGCVCVRFGGGDSNTAQPIGCGNMLDI